MSAPQLLGGIVLAAGAAFCFDGAVALQALEARAVPTSTVGAGLVRRLVARPRWLAATGLAILGWPLQIAALALAPLTIVQPTLALGLVLLLGISVRRLGEPAGPRDIAAVVAIAVGLTLLAWVAPEASHVHAGTVVLVVALGALGALALVPWAARAAMPGAALVVAAGCGYAGAAITTKLLTDTLSTGPLPELLLWAAVTGLLAVGGLGDEMGALQRVRATRVAAGAFALQIVVPVVTAPLLTGEHWGSTAHAFVTAIGLVLVVAGSVTLGSAPAVGRMISGEQPEPA